MNSNDWVQSLDDRVHRIVSLIADEDIHHYHRFQLNIRRLVDLYPIFDLCGRAIPGMSAVTDQAIGGLTMWVLAGFVEMFGLLYALSTLMRLSAKGRLPDRRARKQRQRAARPSAAL